MTQNDTIKHTADTAESSCNTREKDELFKKKKWRNWMFTLNNHSKNDIDTFLKLKNVKYVINEEIGIENKTPHLQGCWMFKNGRSFERLKKLFPRIHLEVAENIYACRAYCSKTETCTGRHWTNIKKPKVVEDYFTFKPYPWQKEVLELIKTKPDHRTVNWYWESKGNAGKSSLTRHILLKYNAIAVSGNARDIKCAIRSFNEEKPLEIVIIDIPRSSFSNVSYKAIEEIKNGFFFSGKYDSGQCIFDIPHVIVFANSEPELDMMSLDRWKVKEI